MVYSIEASPGRNPFLRRARATRESRFYGPSASGWWKVVQMHLLVQAPWRSKSTFTSHFLQLTILSNPPDKKAVVSCVFQDVADDVPTIIGFQLFYLKMGGATSDRMHWIGLPASHWIYREKHLNSRRLVCLQPTNVCQNTLQLPWLRIWADLITWPGTSMLRKLQIHAMQWALVHPRPTIPRF